MGIRYILTVTCPQCGFEDDDVPFAPTCDFVDWKCPKCGHVVDLYALTGITYEDASSAKEIAEMCCGVKKHFLDRAIGKIVEKIIWEKGLKKIQFTDDSYITFFIADESYLSFSLNYTPPVHEWIEAEYVPSPEERQSARKQPWIAIG